jgi:predicted transcriptional regulator
MYENTLELAENKLLVLHIIKSIKYPISNTQLTEIVLENSFINYFMLQQYISELISSDFLKYTENNSKQVLHLTEKGDNVLSFFKDRISPGKIKIIDDYLKKKAEAIKKELNITADYTVDSNNSFLVNLKAIENDSLLIDLKVNVVSKKQAQALCSKWKENPSEIYTKIINVLIEE